MKLLSTLMSRENFPKFAMATMVASGLTGWLCFTLVEQRGMNASSSSSSSALRGGAREKEPHNNNILSHDKALVHAMIENAQESNWKENLENAAIAQERFVLPGRQKDREQPRFVQKIVDRSDQLMAKQQREEEKKRQRQQQQQQDKFQPQTESFTLWKQ